MGYGMKWIQFIILVIFPALALRHVYRIVRSGVSPAGIWKIKYILRAEQPVRFWAHVFAGSSWDLEFFGSLRLLCFGRSSRCAISTATPKARKRSAVWCVAIEKRRSRRRARLGRSPKDDQSGQKAVRAVQLKSAWGR